MTSYLDEAAFNAEVDRLTGLYIRMRVAAKKAGVEIETACLHAAEAGEITQDDAELLLKAVTGRRPSE